MTVKTGLGYYPTNKLVITGRIDQTARLERSGAYNATTGTTLGTRVVCHRLYAPAGANDQFDSVRNGTAWTSGTEEFLSMNSGHVVVWSCSGDGTTSGTIAKNSGPFYLQVSGGKWDQELTNTFARIEALDWGGAVVPIQTTTGSKEIVPGSQYGGVKPTEMIWLQNHEPNINTGTTRGTPAQFAGMMKHLAQLYDTWFAANHGGGTKHIKFAACLSNPGTGVADNFYDRGGSNDITVATGARSMDYTATDIYYPHTENSGQGPVTSTSGDEIAFSAASKFAAVKTWADSYMAGKYHVLPEYAIRMPTSPVSGGTGPDPSWIAQWYAGCDTWQAAHLIGGNYPVKYMCQFVAASVLSNSATGGADNSIIPDQVTNGTSFQLAGVSLRPAFTAYHDQLVAWGNASLNGSAGVTPTGVTAPTLTAGQTSGLLTWTTNGANVTYNIYKDGVKTQSGVVGGSTTIYANSALPLPQTSVYGVKGVGTNGNETALSSTVSVTYLAATGSPPSTPSAPTVTNVGQTTAAAAVTAVTGATGYTWFLDANTGTPDFTSSSANVGMIGLASGSHTVKVKAFNAAGTSSLSPASSSFTMASAPDTTPPSVPTGLTATPTATQVGLFWNASTDTVVTGAITSGMGTYVVTRTDPINGTVTLSGPTLVNTSIIDTSPPAQTTGPIVATYSVAAVDIAGNPSAAATLAVTIPQLPVGTNPTAVLVLPASVSAGQLFAFTDASTPGTGGNIISYMVEVVGPGGYNVQFGPSSAANWQISLPYFGLFTFTDTVVDASGNTGKATATLAAYNPDGGVFPYTGAPLEIPGASGGSASANNTKLALFDTALQAHSDRLDDNDATITTLDDTTNTLSSEVTDLTGLTTAALTGIRQADLEFAPSAAFILVDSAGARWRVTVNTDGTFHSTAIDGGIVTPPPSFTTLLTDTFSSASPATFTGSDGTTAVTGWTFAGTGTESIQGNRLRLQTGATAFGTAEWAIWTGQTAVRDSDVTLDVEWESTGRTYAAVAVQSGDTASGGSFPDNGYIFEASSGDGTVRLVRAVATTYTGLVSSVPFNPVAGVTRYSMHLSTSYDGTKTTIRATIWPFGGTRPAPQIVYTDTSPYTSTGKTYLSVQNDTNAVRSLWFDNVTPGATSIDGAKWTVTTANSGTLTTAAGRARFTGVGHTSSDIQRLKAIITSPANPEVLAYFYPKTASRMWVWFRADTGLTFGYTLRTRADLSGWDIVQIASGGAETLVYQGPTPAQSTASLVANTRYGVRIRAQGAQILARVWDSALTEPSTWDASVAATLTTAGAVGFASDGGDIDDVTISDATITTGGSTNPPPTGTSVTALLALDDASIGSGLNQITYTSGWTAGSGAAKYQTTDHYTSTTGETATLNFYTDPSGGVKIYSAKDTHHGVLGITIDGGTEQTVSLYAASRVDQALVWTSPVLSVGAHTLVLRCTGTAGTGGGTIVTVDRIDLINAYTSTTTPPVVSPPPSTGFVYRTGQKIMRSGVEIRPGGGMNAADLDFIIFGTWGPSPTNLNTFMAAMHGRVVRFMCFAGSNLTKIDAIMDAADANSVLLVPYLCDEANNLGGATPNGNATAFYGGGWTGVYKTWLGTLAARYSSRQCILAWELVNEPSNNTNLKSFFTGAISYMKSVDPNHLVFAGNFAEWPYGGQAGLVTLLTGTGTDAVCIHEYDGNGNGFSGGVDSNGVPSPHSVPVAQAASQLGLPWYVGEFGFAVGGAAYGQTATTNSGAATMVGQKFTAYGATVTPGATAGTKNAFMALYWGYREDGSAGPNILAGNASAPLMTAIDTATAWSTS